MSMSPSIPMSHAAPLLSAERLSAERLRAGLEASGYRCDTALLPGSRSLSPGCAMSLQFGDRIAKDADGVTCLTVRCSIQINGSSEHVSGVTRWQIRKQVHAPGRGKQLCFAIEADLILGRDISLADILTHGGDVYRHLHMLIGDASATLRDRSVENRRGGEVGGLVSTPVMRIEARFFGDLAAGRSGLVTRHGAGSFGHSAEVAARHIQITRAACDWLQDDILPDLASAIRRMVLQVQTTIRYRSPTNAATADVRSHSGSWPHDPSPQSAATQSTEDAAATLVPEQIQ
jgi:hypothetical protein